MMQTKLAALVVMSIGCGLPAAHAMEASSRPDTMEPPQLHATALNASRVTLVPGTATTIKCEKPAESMDTEPTGTRLRPYQRAPADGSVELQ